MAFLLQVSFNGWTQLYPLGEGLRRVSKQASNQPAGRGGIGGRNPLDSMRAVSPLLALHSWFTGTVLVLYSYKY